MGVGDGRGPGYIRCEIKNVNNFFILCIMARDFESIEINSKTFFIMHWDSRLSASAVMESTVGKFLFLSFWCSLLCLFFWIVKTTHGNENLNTCI